MGDTYQKASGSAGIKGTDFQINLLTIFVLNALRLNIKNWKLSTENILAGKFDDAVLEFDDGAILLQAKHKDGKKINRDQLLSKNSKNDDFSLPKYFLSYLDVCKKFSVKLVIICTNTQVDAQVLKFVNQKDVIEESILHYQNGASFLTFSDDIVPDLITNTKAYYEINFKGKGVDESLITEENAKEFLKHLQLYVDYPAGKHLEKAIEKILSEVRYFNHSKYLSNILSGISSRDLHQKIKEWFEHPKGEYLTETGAKAIFCEIKSEKYLEGLEEYKLFFKNDDFNITDSKNKVFHIIVDEGYLLYVTKIYRHLQNSKSKILYIGSDYDRNVSMQIIKAFELPRYTFLIIVTPQFPEFLITNICDSLEIILQKRDYKKVIFVAEHNNELAGRMTSMIDSEIFNEPLTFEDLSEDSQKMLLSKRNIIFQGEDVSLGDLLPIPTTTEDTESLKSEVLEKLVKNEKIAVGMSLIGLEEGFPRYYINRKFQGLVKKKGNKQKITMYGTVCEEDICKTNNKMILISDSAGTGKTTVLKNLAVTLKKNNPKSWVVRIELNHYTDILRNSLLNNHSLSILELLNSKNPTESSNNLEKFVFSLKEKVILILDGVDEISPDYTQLILDLLLEIQEAKNFKQVFVATRPHVTNELETLLNITSFMLVPLTKEDQVNFFARYWTCNLRLESAASLDKCELYAEVLLKKVSVWIREWYNEEEFVASPLHATMLAEAFMENKGAEDWEGCEEFVCTDKEEPKLPEIMNITNLYMKFIEKKREIFISKGNPSGNTVANPALLDQFEDCLAYHRFLALEVIIDEVEQCKLFSCYKYNDRYSDERILLKMGIVQQSYNRLTFAHRTFAEYFVAESIFNELELGNSDVRFPKFLVTEVFVKDKYQIIRHNLNNFLLNRIPCLPSQTFKNYMSTVNDTIDFDLIHLLIHESNHEIIRFILKVIDFNVIGNRKNFLSKYLRFFCKENTLNTLKYNGGIDMICNGLAPLHFASFNGLFRSVKFLLEMGADVNIKSEIDKAFTSLKLFWIFRYDDHDCFNLRANHPATHFAVWQERLDILELLVEHGADLNVADKDGNTVAHLAAMKDNFDIFNYISEHGVDICSGNKFGKTPLHFAAEANSFEIIEFLLRHDANINVVDKNGNTPLHDACYKNNLKTVELLVNLGADIYVANNMGRTALHLAMLKRYRGVVEFLLKQGAYIY